MWRFFGKNYKKLHGGNIEEIPCWNSARDAWNVEDVSGDKNISSISAEIPAYISEITTKEITRKIFCRVPVKP